MSKRAGPRESVLQRGLGLAGGTLRHVLLGRVLAGLTGLLALLLPLLLGLPALVAEGGVALGDALGDLLGGSRPRCGR